MTDNTIEHWLKPPGILHLHDEEIHLWRGDLDQPPDSVSRFSKILSPKELAQAGRKRDILQRNRYICSRGMLRLILEPYLHIPAAEINMDYGPWGKPFLTGLQGGPAIHFNLAHTGPDILLAFSLYHPIGVDIEYAGRSTAFHRLSRRFFSERENAVLQPLTNGDLRHAFYIIWTGKEAYVKALGRGLTLVLDGFDVSGLIRSDQAWPPVYNDRTEPTGYYVHSFLMENHIRCALCISSGMPLLRYYATEFTI